MTDAGRAHAQTMTGGTIRFSRWLDVRPGATGAGFTPLHLAVDLGHVALVELFFTKGSDVNTELEDDTTLLHLAASALLLLK
jgi:hypothetical protein